MADLGLRAHRLLVGLCAATLLVAACGTEGDGPSAAAPSGVLSGDLVVLAAASLTGSLEEIARTFEDAHPDVDVQLSFEGSSTLVAQVLEGAPADVVATADTATMGRLDAAGGVDGAPQVFATNTIEIVVAAGNPLGIRGLADLDGAVLLSLCQPAVPCGAYAARAFAAVGLDVPPGGREQNVRAVLAKVQLGEADAGIVYRTDVLAADGVEGVRLDAAQVEAAEYPAAAVTDSANPRAARAFVEALRSSGAQAILQRHGFGPP